MVTLVRDADEWFAALDRRVITAPEGQWITQILGVHSQGPEHWIQIARADEPESSLILHVAASTTVSAAVAVRGEGAGSVIGGSSGANPGRA